MAETIKEYLVSLGFRVEKAEEARFKQTLDVATKTAAGVAAALAAAAGAISAAVIKISSDFDSIYFASQRTGASVVNIKSLSYALSQVGGSSGQAQSAIEGVAAAIRTNPGIEGMLNNLGVATRENGKLRDTADIIDGIVKSLSATHPYYTSAQIAGILGIDEGTFQVLMTQWPKIKQYQDDYKKRAAEFGIDPDKAAESSNRLMTSFRQLMLDLELVTQKIAVDLQPLITKYLGEFAAWVRAHSEDIVRWVTAIVEAVRGLAQDLGKLVVALQPVTDAFMKMTGSLTGADGLKIALEAVLLYMAGAWLAGMLGSLSTLMRHPAFAVLAAAMGIGIAVAGTDEAAVTQGSNNRLGIRPKQEPSTFKKWWDRQWGKGQDGAEKSKDDAPPKEGLAQIKSKNGQAAWVAKEYQKQFQGFIDDLEATGYVIKDLGGFADRANVNSPGQKSKHALGQAIDINPGANPNRSTKTDLPPQTGELAKKWGLGWGMNWRSVKDPMHFSTAPNEGGRMMTDEEVDALKKQQPAPEKRSDLGQINRALADIGAKLEGANLAVSQPAPLGNSISRSASISQNTKIEVHGSTDPSSTAVNLENLQPRVNAELLRNAQSAFI